MARCLYADGRYHEAARLFEEIFEKKAQQLKRDDPKTLESMSWLASAYRNQGRWKEAEELGTQVMDMRKTVLGPDHPDTLTRMWNLAYTLKDQGRHDEAITLLKICVHLQKQRLGPAHPDTTQALSDLQLWETSLLCRPHLDNGQLDPRICLKTSHDQITADEYRHHIQNSQNLLIQDGFSGMFHPLLSPLRNPYSAMGTVLEDLHQVD